MRREAWGLAQMEEQAGQTPTSDQMSLTYLASKRAAPQQVLQQQKCSSEKKMSVQAQQRMLEKSCWPRCNSVQTSRRGTSATAQCLELAKSSPQERLEGKKLQRLLGTDAAIGVSTCCQPEEGFDFHGGS